VSDELLAANNDVAAALEAKKEATVATEAAMKLAKDVEKLQQDQAKISGEIAALSMQKLDLEKDLTTSDSRMNNARAKLAEYLDKWNNRDRLTQEIDQMSTRVNALKKSESELTDGISRLTDQSIKLETKTKGLTQEIKNAEAQLADLKNQQKEALAELLELQKLKKEAEGKGDVGPGDEGKEGQND
jgi:chromosome segregation ATPase